MTILLWSVLEGSNDPYAESNVVLEVAELEGGKLYRSTVRKYRNVDGRGGFHEVLSQSLAFVPDESSE